MTEEMKGDCFAAALSYLFAQAGDDLKGQRFVLVHGNLPYLPQDEEVNHAWVEEGDSVHEVANGCNERVPKDVYYAQHRVGKTRRYTAWEATIRAVKHSGPWDE